MSQFKPRDGRNQSQREMRERQVLPSGAEIALNVQEAEAKREVASQAAPGARTEEARMLGR